VLEDMNYTCPVCGYDRLRYPPRDNTICPSCGTEFSYDDFLDSHEYLRAQWIAKGARWWSPNQPPPPGWNPVVQLLRSGYGYTSVTQNVTDRIVLVGQSTYQPPANFRLVESSLPAANALGHAAA